jgi:hypothetical protein
VLSRGEVAPSARGALRAFKRRKESRNTIGATVVVSGLIFVDLRWSEYVPVTLLIISGMDNTRLRFHLTLYTSSA